MTLRAYTAPYLLATFLLLAMVPPVWRRRAATGAGAYFALVLACAFWCLASAAELAAVGVEAKRIAFNLKYLGIMAVPPAWLVFALQYSGRQRRVRAHVAALLCVVPLVTSALLWVGGQRLMVYDARIDPSGPSLAVSFGLWYRIMGGYEYLLLLGAAVILFLSVAHTHRLFRAQGLLLLLAFGLPFTANALHALELGPAPYLDLTPPTFAASALCTALGLMRFRLFELVPAARRTVIETMPDAILVFDRGGCVVDANPAAADLFRGSMPLVGRQVQELLPAAQRHLLAPPDARHPATIVEAGDSGRRMELRVCPIGRSDEPSGWLALFRDVTEREALLAQLQQAVASVHTLSGLIPICACCKRVRDDEGYWQQVESYLSEHSQAEFTHGICPECAARLYPQFPLPDQAPAVPDRRPGEA